MLSKRLLSLFALGTIISGYGMGDHSSPPCEKSKNPMRLTVRHVEPNGIGYNEGYSTLEGFFSPPEPRNPSWFPFLDLRGHVFNNGKLAANAGIGLRHLFDRQGRIFGGYVYYDYRDTKRQHYNQVSLGLETLGQVWDFRINGYLPIGDKRSPFYHTGFGYFRGHYAFIEQKYEFAMKGANAEAAIHVDAYENFPLYFAAGPYYLSGKQKSAWGGQVRAAVDLSEYVRCEGNLSYDSAFKWIGQGQVSLIFPFGRKRDVCKNPCHSLEEELRLATRVLQRVERMEIIPVDRGHKTTEAIDPLTGRPYFFDFVDNRSHSAGTYESPYATLMDAESASSPYDVIYVFAGDGTAYDTGITLSIGQKLFGSGVTQHLNTTLGALAIPRQSILFPQIAPPSSNSGVTLADKNEVSGISIVDIRDASGGIYGTGTTSVSIHDNLITNVDTTNGFIYLNNCEGQVQIVNNTLTQGGTGGNGGAIVIDNHDFPGTILTAIINQNTIADIASGEGIVISTDTNGEGGNTAIITISGNFLENINQSLGIGWSGFASGIGIYTDIGGTAGGGDTIAAVIAGNTLNNVQGFNGTAVGGSGIAIYTDLLGNGDDFIEVTLSNNTLNNVIGGSVVPAPTTADEIQGLLGGSGIGIYTDIDSGGNTITALMENNTLNNIVGGSIFSSYTDTQFSGVVGGSGIGVYTSFDDSGDNLVIPTFSNNILSNVSGGSITTPLVSESFVFGGAGGSGIAVCGSFNNAVEDTIMPTFSGNQLNTITGGSVTAFIIGGAAAGSGIAVYSSFSESSDVTITASFTDNTIANIAGGSLATVEIISGAAGSGIGIYTSFYEAGEDYVATTISNNTLSNLVGGAIILVVSEDEEMDFVLGTAAGSGIGLYSCFGDAGSDEILIEVSNNTLDGFSGGSFISAAPSFGNVGGSGVGIYCDIGYEGEMDDAIKGSKISRASTPNSFSKRKGQLAAASSEESEEMPGAQFEMPLSGENNNIFATISGNTLNNMTGGPLQTGGESTAMVGGGAITFALDVGGGGSNEAEVSISGNTMGNVIGGSIYSPDSTGAVGGSAVAIYADIGSFDSGSGGTDIFIDSSITDNVIANISGGSTVTGSSPPDVEAGSGIAVFFDVYGVGGDSDPSVVTILGNTITNLQAGQAN